LTDDAVMRSLPHQHCIVCGGPGEPLYQGLSDRLFGAIGSWGLRRCADRGCGLIWIDPLPLAEDLGKAYERYYTHHDMPAPDSWLRNAFVAATRAYLAAKYGYPMPAGQWWAAALVPLVYLHPGRRAVMDFKVMWLPSRPGGRLLDVGCGSGALPQFMQELGWRAEGVDFDPEAARNAAAKGVMVHVGELAAQHFPDGAFDAVTMSHFIEHVHDPLLLLRECHRILKPGGRLVVVTPNNASFGHHIYKENWRGLEPPRHLHLFNIACLDTLAARSGFGERTVSTSIRDAYGMFLGSRSIARSGQYVMGSLQPRRLRAWARAMELVEWLVLKARPDAGEELVLIARK
jgi:SAM-dependent methyltransferase